PVVLVDLAGVPDECGPYGAIGLGIVGVARHILREIFETGDGGAGTELDAVLPGRLRLAGAREKRERAARGEIVRALSEPEQAFPAIADAVAAVHGVRGQGLVIHVVGIRARVEMRSPVAVEGREAELVALVQSVREPCGNVLVAVTVL